MKCWYALYTKPHKEHHVSSFLESRGFETYLPTIQVRKNRRRKTKLFFSCYLFIRDFGAVFDKSLSSSDRARVLVDILGRLTACEIELDCLEKVTRKRPGHWMD